MRTLLLLLLLCAQGQAAIYRWVDDRGVIHYGDLPPPGQAEPVTLTPGNRVTLHAPILPTVSPPPVETAAHYTLAIINPAPDATLRSNQGRLAVRVTTDPKPAPDHSLQLLVDDRLHPLKGGRITLENVDRGSHRLQALMVDAEGALLAESQAITVHLHRQSRLFGNPRHQQPPAENTPP
ncbi:DUF4124 domain-containing protein [Ferrimonas sediminicola]|nr:DUF4124 domain-containing protein [Ferrimonas sediminicola]